VSGGPSHRALLAMVGDELIGIGESIIGSDATEAEVAFAVADEHHREGVATLLLERLAVIAQRDGVRRLTATVLPGNDDMRSVFRTVGLPVGSRSVDGVVEIVLDVTTRRSLRAAAAGRRGPS
jgi:GNAT superfamily N-acetyltransferase